MSPLPGRAANRGERIKVRGQNLSPLPGCAANRGGEDQGEGPKSVSSPRRAANRGGEDQGEGPKSVSSPRPRSESRGEDQGEGQIKTAKLSPSRSPLASRPRKNGSLPKQNAHSPTRPLSATIRQPNANSARVQLNAVPDTRTRRPATPRPITTRSASLDVARFHSPVGTAGCSQGREPLENERNLQFKPRRGDRK